MANKKTDSLKKLQYLPVTFEKQLPQAQAQAQASGAPFPTNWAVPASHPPALREQYPTN